MVTERSTGALMFIGERCALEECHREDFLPFKCQECRESFCASHFRPSSHRCSSHDENLGDFRVPLCPLCDQPPEGWKRDEDPNIAMDRHLSTGKCPAIDENGLRKQTDRTNAFRKKANQCNFSKCQKVMVVPITCPQCRTSFCPSHRAPAQHACQTSSRQSQSAPAMTKKKNTSLNGATSALKNLNIRSESNGISTTQAQPAQKDQKTSSGVSKSPFAGGGGGLFDKTDKRAKAERKSAIKAMQERQKKGLLSAAEETRLAEEMAALAKSSRGAKPKEDCVIC
ncbi:hypothetical protein IE53DRAFT_310908 [Violaceomyces palustris]|uniref:Uncharacterized protein n=1 Tax=Violaceomyces palustris TaxID=1673888 RepID=A0ACD0P4N6_9BASI|nr:hypothetical protein IE53DRAFT_310908 [Violaceomyces palustris]